ncbi:MAG: NADH:ubiquinone reductase (Na(+)-transporting) subunit F [Bacteroidales bacterium]
MILLDASITTIVLAGIVVFLAVILLLVAILLFAKKRLTPQGEVTLTINKEKELTVKPGNTLLSTLGEHEIYLPSACGGQGTCGVCHCQIHEGAGDILPTEKGFFSRKEQLNDWRLSCQVKVKEDLDITIPKEIFGIKKWECEVISNKNVATFIKEFIVKLPEGEEMDFNPGGYVQIDVPKYKIDFGKEIEIEEEYREDWEKSGLFNLKARNSEEIFRAYSMANHPAEGNIIKLNVRIATPPWDHKKNRFMNVPPGIASSYIFALKPGDKVKLSGPYGDFFIKDTDKEMVYIGGGAGMAPLRSHIFHLFKTLGTNRKVSYWYGARSKREMFYEDEFEEIAKNNDNFDFNVALSEPLEEDNWKGYTGFIHQVVHDEYLSKHEEPEEIEYYLCGPPIMNESVLKMLDDLGVPQENIDLDDFGG